MESKTNTDDSMLTEDDANHNIDVASLSLHSAAARGNLRAIQGLVGKGSDINMRDENGESALHIAAKRDDNQSIEMLVSAGADINVQDSSGSTALHVACQRHSINAALSLMHCQASFDVADNAGETALHKACRENLLTVVQTMCAVGASKECPVNTFNKAGQSALHLAARNGSAELVRCLLLAGADIDLVNKDGVRAEDIALGQGHTELADFLSKLSSSMSFSKHDPYINQLLPSNRAIWRIKVKLFGNCGVGKSTLIDSLKCGYIRGLFRHFTSAGSQSTTTSTNGERSTAAIDVQDVEAAAGNGSGNPGTRVAHENCTRCVNITNVNVSGAGELSLWEFSGYEPYYIVYDQFVGDPNCVHVVVFRACDPPQTQIQQLRFWLDFLRARIAPAEPIGFAGTQLWAPRVLLIATHVDKISNFSRRNSRGETEFPGESSLVTSLQKEFGAELLIAPRICALDARQAADSDMKALKTVLGEMKQFLCQYLPPSLGFLESTVNALPSWTRLLGGFPVVKWTTFVEYIRSRVHILATENHLQELICQLQLMGEVVYIESEVLDLIILDPGWLFRDVICRLLSPGAALKRHDGTVTLCDLTTAFPGLDATDLTSLLIALELCGPAADHTSGYHLSCLDELPTPADVPDHDTSGTRRRGGIELRAANTTTSQLVHIFRRVQQALWNHHYQHRAPDGKARVRLTEWSTGTEMTVVSDVNSSATNVVHRATVSLVDKGRAVRITCDGHDSEVLYQLQSDALTVVLAVIEATCPGMYVERAPISTRHQHSYRTRDVIAAMLNCEDVVVGCQHDVNDDAGAEISGSGESLVDLVAFGSPELYAALHPVGPDLHVSHLPIYARCRLATLLDPVHPLGRDWCLLAVGLGLSDAVPQVDSSQTVTLSRTDAVLAVWSHESSATVRRLLDCISGMLQRTDVANQLLALTPIVGSFTPHCRLTGPTETSPSHPMPITSTDKQT